VFENRYGTPRAAGSKRPCRRDRMCCSISIGRARSKLREKGTGGRLSAFSSCRRPPADLEKTPATPARRIPIGVIRGRMSRASHEMSHWAEYDYIVINHDIDAAFGRGAVNSEGGTAEARTAATGLSTFVRELQRQIGEIARRQARFQAKACPGLDPGWETGFRAKEKTRQIKNPAPRFDSIETEKARLGWVGALFGPLRPLREKSRNNSAMLSPGSST